MDMHSVTTWQIRLNNCARRMSCYATGVATRPATKITLSNLVNNNSMDFNGRIYFATGRERNIVISACVCLSVCLSARISRESESHVQILPNCLCIITYGRGWVFLRQRCDILCTSGFVADVMFAHTLSSTLAVADVRVGRSVASVTVFVRV